MENILKAAIIFVSIFISTCFADTLVLSTKLKIDYPTPVLIAHGSEDLVVKYKGWSFLHTVFNPKGFYPHIDLTGLEKDFVRLMFDEKKQSKYPEWFIALARGQAKAFSISPSSSHKFNIGDVEVLTTYNKADKKGYIFIIEDLSVHQISLHGTKTDLDLIAKNIKER